MNRIFSMASTAIFIMAISLNASAATEAESTEAQPHQADTHQGHIEHQQLKANESTETDTTSPRLRNVTHPKTGHVQQRLVGQ